VRRYAPAQGAAVADAPVAGVAEPA
jgi:hypothetical protein